MILCGKIMVGVIVKAKVGECMRVANLGPIEQCEIALAQQTILIGENNSGKTYISYLLYGVLKTADVLKDSILKHYIVQQPITGGVMVIDKQKLQDHLLRELVKQLNMDISSELPKIFNLPATEFAQTSVTLEQSDVEFLIGAKTKGFPNSITLKDAAFQSDMYLQLTQDEKAWHLNLQFIANQEDYNEALFYAGAFRLLRAHVFTTAHSIYFPAERNGINVFRKELLTQRSIQSFDLTNEIEQERYPLAIADYMKYLANSSLKKVGKDRVLWQGFSRDILCGHYDYDAELNEYFYREAAAESKRIPLKSTSSSTKSLFGLATYIRHEYQVGDVIFIDEPEMNLDPMHQIEMANFLVELTAAGVYVVISTHSDYLLRATTNALLKRKVAQLPEVSIEGYYFTKNQVSPLGKLSEVDTIEIFDNMNAVLEDEYFRLLDRLTGD